VLGHFSGVGGRTVQVRTTRGRGHTNRGSFGRFFEVVLSIFHVAGPYSTIRTVDYLHGFRGANFLGGPYNSTNLTCFSRKTILGAVSGFSLGWKLCYCC